MDELKDQKFNITLPATLQKGKDGEWRVYGLASTANRDQQGEIVDVKGLDLSPIKKGRGLFNFDHGKGPENVVGVIDTYKTADEGLYLGGYLFKNHDRAKSLYQIMSSLNKSDSGRMGMSVEGVIKKRSGKDGKTISKAVIHSCALTMNPVNSDTFVDLAKSLTACDEFETDADSMEDQITQESDNVTFSKAQVEAITDIFKKALSVGDGKATQIPAERSGGDALAQEDLDKKCKKCLFKAEMCKCRKSLKKMGYSEMKKSLVDTVKKLKDLYPEHSYSEIFEAVKDRLNTKFDIEYADDEEK